MEKKNFDVVKTFAHSTAFMCMHFHLRSIRLICFSSTQFFLCARSVTLQKQPLYIENIKHKAKGFSTLPVYSLQPEQRENLVKTSLDQVMSIGAENKEQIYKKPEKIAIKKLKIAILWIQCTRNNTLITLTDTCGKTLAWSSGGVCGFKNSRKSTTYAAETVAISMSEKIYEKGYNSIHVRTTGSGRGKKKAISALSRCGLVVHKITEYGPQAFNGCRPKRKRRL